ncbi:hypothetical protein Aph02nite_32850 [Actinoplanes philippinensis]|uniref:Uncharacterized protein n=1 Tax=Actinoplanes philippinensis TaxID=35752 RepID=A0A1I2E1W9_9ACTN|nr:hypothetical protein Aph02nite_32850 [Actinoplanes philippinensis]SFE86541.1 hypothetical protein SAMN05421541_104119 [Actinoplanes philippinensis]
MLARRSGFTPPATTEAAFRFAADYARVNLLTYLYAAFDAPAADTAVHERRAGETNRDRVRRGLALSTAGRPPGSLGDLFDAPTGDTRPADYFGADVAAETWEGMWSDQWLLDGLEHAHTLAEAVLAGDIATLEIIAGVPLADAITDAGLFFGDVDNQVLSLASDAFRERLEDHEPAFDPERAVDMTAPLSALPGLLQEARHEWTATEQLALVIAGLAPIERTAPQF